MAVENPLENARALGIVGRQVVREHARDRGGEARRVERGELARVGISPEEERYEDLAAHRERDERAHEPRKRRARNPFPSAPALCSSRSITRA